MFLIFFQSDTGLHKVTSNNLMRLFYIMLCSLFTAHFEVSSLWSALDQSWFNCMIQQHVTHDSILGDVAGTEGEAAVVAPAAVCPLVIEPEIDIEVCAFCINTRLHRL